MDETLAVLRPYVDRGRHAYRNRAVALYAAALVVLAITVMIAGASFYRSGPIVLVGILACGGLVFHLWYRSLDWARNRVLVALAQRPAEVIAARVLPAEGRAALIDDRQVEVRTSDATILLTVDRHELGPLRDALAAHCPSCQLRGWEAVAD
jgi:hypothetical protein